MARRGRVPCVPALQPRLLLSGRRVRLFQASAEGVYTRVDKDAARGVKLAIFENIPFTGFDQGAPGVVGYGDIHAAYLTTVGGKTLFNVGSVGNPLDETTASYALLEGKPGDASPGPFAIQTIRVLYDIEKAIATATRMDMPDLDAYTRELGTARYRDAS